MPHGDRALAPLDEASGQRASIVIPQSTSSILKVSVPFAGQEGNADG